MTRLFSKSYAKCYWNVLGVICAANLLLPLPKWADAATDELRLPEFPACGKKWWPGVHYNVLLPVQSKKPSSDKVEILELRMYTSDPSVLSRTSFQEWLKKNSDHVRFIRIPAVTTDYAVSQARMFFTLEELGRADLHDKLRDWVFADRKRWDIYHNRTEEKENLDLNLSFARRSQIDADRFVKIYRSAATDEKIERARSLPRAYQVNGTPTVVINRRYSTSIQRLIYPRKNQTDEDFAQFMNLINYLTTSESRGSYREKPDLERLTSESPLGTNAVAERYSKLCASCHGRELEGGEGPSLIDDHWAHGSDEKTILRSIREGKPDVGMPAWGEILSECEIEELVQYIRGRDDKHVGEQRRSSYQDVETKVSGNILHTKIHDFRIDVVADGLEAPWGMDLLPDDRIVITERYKGLRVVEGGKPISKPIQGTPILPCAPRGGGLRDVLLHPSYQKSRWIYLSYSGDDADCSSGKMNGMITIVRGRIADGRWLDQELIWQAPRGHYLPSVANSNGGRMLFDNKGYLYFSIGYQQHSDMAQDLGRPTGKIHRILEDGGIPLDNPFVGRSDALGSIWSYGHRNPQGLAIDPRSGMLWSSEHGPRDGDELNIIERGRNYGWPIVSFGLHAGGVPPIGGTERAGMEPPVLHWTPAIAVSSIKFYNGSAFPGWWGNLLITSLTAEQMHRYVVDGRYIKHEEILLDGVGRIRDVDSDSDGAIYLLTEALPDRHGRILRLVPVDKN